MRWTSRDLVANQEGVVTVEFSLTVIVFIFMVLFVAETARLSYVSSVIDLAVSEAAKDAKNGPSSVDGGYRNRFEKRLMEQGGALWGFLTKADAVDITIAYSGSINDMISNGGSGNFAKQTLARYQLSYQYHPMFFPFPGFWANNLLTREVIFVQEYERSRFMY
jgi:Flp pilus assembly protein TadG